MSSVNKFDCAIQEQEWVKNPWYQTWEINISCTQIQFINYFHVQHRPILIWVGSNMGNNLMHSQDSPSWGANHPLLGIGHFWSHLCWVKSTVRAAYDCLEFVDLKVMMYQNPIAYNHFPFKECKFEVSGYPTFFDKET